ncbi:hypothetical protein Tco_0866591, partial [Tanacetum coccineum]
MGTKQNATSFGGNNVAGQAKVVKCYNFKGEWHIARQCIQPKRPRNSACFKEKMLLVQAQESGQVLDEEQLAFLADCDDISSAKVVRMANISSYDSDVLSEVNDHLFELLLSQDIVYICVNSLATCNNCLEMQQSFIREYNENLVLKVELANKKEHMIEKKVLMSYILREIVKHARALRPLDSDLDSACKIDHRFQEVLVYVKDTCPSLTKPSEKLVVVTPLNKNKKVRFAEAATSSSNTQKQADSHKTQDSNKSILPSTRMKSSTSASRSQPSGNTKHNMILRTTSGNMKNKLEDHPRSVKSKSNKMNRVIEPVCNAHVKHTMLNANSELICVKCNQCMFDANHDVCFLEFVNDVNMRSKSKSAKKRKNKNIWKPTGKVFTDIGYRWKPLGRTFTIAGKTCHLTRITSTKVVPFKETTSKSINTQNPQIMVDNRRPNIAKSVGIVRFGNDQIAKIMDYGDYQMGNVMISQVYYVEGLGPGPQLMTLEILNTGLMPNPPLPTPYVPPTKKDWDMLFQPMYNEYFNPPPSVASPVPIVVDPDTADSTDS